MSVNDKLLEKEKENENEIELTKSLPELSEQEKTNLVNEQKGNLLPLLMDDSILKETPNQPSSNGFSFSSEKEAKGPLAIFGIFVLIFFVLLMIGIASFVISNQNNPNIFKGIYIMGIDVGGLSKEEAYETLDNYLRSQIPEEIKVNHGDFETSISTDSISLKFDLHAAIDTAYQIGRSGNILQNNIVILTSKFSPISIQPVMSLDESSLTKSLEDISTKLPDTIVESSYYIEGSNLVLTKGKPGHVVDVEKMISYIKEQIQNLQINGTSLSLITKIVKPEPLNIDAIHDELYKEPKNASFTQNPYSIYPSENGVDFAISLEQAKALLAEEKEEYSIPLTVLVPAFTTNMIGREAFPDLLSEFSTKYQVSNRDRTTNLMLAAGKINGTVLMPGEVFSYNRVVGERTIAAGYKEAPIYVSGEVVDGLGGGICQITSTLYNAVVYANLDIVQRSNHQFVPSYVTASRDATVVYGAIDFQFKNNRNYPIKITCSVGNGIANFKIYGLKTDQEYEVQIASRITSQTATSIHSEAYKILKQNGQVVSQTLLSRDTYKKH